MGRFLLRLDRGKCIGSGECTIANTKLWQMGTDDKVNIAGGRKNEDNSVQEIEISNDELNENIDAAQSCPVRAIKVVDKESEKELV